MRVIFYQVKTRYQAKKLCPFTPVRISKVAGGFICFESWDDYVIFKNQK